MKFSSFLILFCALFLFLPIVSHAEISLGEQLEGRLLLQVEDRGRIWYINPENTKRKEILYSEFIQGLGQLSLGISSADLERAAVDDQLFKQLQGKFLLQVENHGRLWYVDPLSKQLVEMFPENYFSLMGTLALGISNQDLMTISEQRSTSTSCEVRKSQDELYAIALPEEVVRVSRATYLETVDSLLLVVEETGGNRALWSYDHAGNFKQLLSLDYPLVNGFVDVTSSDTIYFRTDSPHFLYRSDDFGATWQSVGSEGMDTFWGIEESEDGVLYGSAWSEPGNSPYLYKSEDEGVYWFVWKNFWEIFPEKAVQYDVDDERRALRHLHDIVFYHETIILGTGDVAGQTLVSEDGGETWEEIVDNGFTSHIILPEQNSVLLGGDSAHGHGINLYNFETKRLQKVWSHFDCGWSGFVHSMDVSQGVSLAAVQIEESSGLKYGILSSEDQYHWQPLFEFEADPSVAHIPVFVSKGPGGRTYVSLNGVLHTFSY
jgi:hypothetical protein